MDVIVNTVGQDLDLSQGAVSSSLLAVAGPAIQQECRTQIPAGQQMSAGQVIRTAGHQLRCKDVLHGSCSKWDAGAGKCEQVSVIFSTHHPLTNRISRAHVQQVHGRLSRSTIGDKYAKDNLGEGEFLLKV